MGTPATHGHGHTQTCTFTRGPTSRVHTLLALPLGALGARERDSMRAARGSSEGDGPTARPPPLPQAKGPISPGPGSRTLTGARRAQLRAGGPARGAAGGRSDRWVPQELAARRPHARPLGSAAGAGPRARAPAPPRRGAAPPPALVRATATQAGGRPGCSLTTPDPSTRPSPLDGE